MKQFIELAVFALQSIHNIIRNKDTIDIKECFHILDREFKRTHNALSPYRIALREEATKRIDFTKAFEMGKFAYLAYQKPDSTKLYIKREGITIEAQKRTYSFVKKYNFIDFLNVNSSASTDKLSKGYIVESEDELIVAIKGTSTLDDWLIDLNVLPLSTLFNSKKVNELNSLGLFVHPGFLKVSLWVISKLQELLPLITDLKKKKRLVLTGHSLGGAVALVSGWIATNINLLEIPINVFAFGAPSVDTNQKIVTHSNLSEFRIVRPGDAVAGVGLKMFDEWDDTTSRFILSNHGEMFYFDNSTAARALLLFEFIQVVSKILQDKISQWPSLEEQKHLADQEKNNISETLRLIKSDILGLSSALELIRLELKSKQNMSSIPHPIRLLKTNTSLSQQDFFIFEHPKDRYIEDLNLLQ